MNQQGTFSHCFHPGCHFGHLFLAHSHIIYTSLQYRKQHMECLQRQRYDQAQHASLCGTWPSASLLASAPAALAAAPSSSTIHMLPCANVVLQTPSTPPTLPSAVQTANHPSPSAIAAMSPACPGGHTSRARHDCTYFCDEQQSTLCRTTTHCMAAKTRPKTQCFKHFTTCHQDPGLQRVCLTL